MLSMRGARPGAGFGVPAQMSYPSTGLVDSGGAEVFVTRGIVASEATPAGAPREGDRRTAVRYACQRDCLVFPEGGSGVSNWYGRTYNLSAAGMALILMHPLQPGTELRIESQGPGNLSSLRAR